MASFSRDDKVATQVGGGLYITKNCKMNGVLTQVYETATQAGQVIINLKWKTFSGAENKDAQGVFMTKKDGTDREENHALIGSLSGVLGAPANIRTAKKKIVVPVFTQNKSTGKWTRTEEECMMDCYVDLMEKEVGMLFQIQKQTYKPKGSDDYVQRFSEDGVPYFHPVIVGFFNAKTGQTYGEMLSDSPAKQMDEKLAKLSYPDNHPMTTGTQPAKSPAKTSTGTPSTITFDIDSDDIPF
jgi:hypothetical protein